MNAATLQAKRNQPQFCGNRPLRTHVIAAALLTYEALIFNSAKRFTAQAAARGKEELAVELAAVSTEELEAFRASLLDQCIPLESLHITKDTHSRTNIFGGLVGTTAAIGTSIYAFSIGAGMLTSILLPCLILSSCILLIGSSHTSPTTRRIWFADLLESVIARRTGRGGRRPLTRIRAATPLKANISANAA